MHEAKFSVKRPRPIVNLTEELIERFWRSVDKNGPIPAHVPELGQCWQWLGPRTPLGYGIFNVGQEKYSAHRTSYTITNGHIEDAFHILHNCDNPSCVRHLRQGTALDNRTDCKVRGRIPSTMGIKNPHCKLTDKDVLEMLRDYLDPEVSPKKDITKRFGVVPGQLVRIVEGRAWSSVTGFTYAEKLPKSTRLVMLKAVVDGNPHSRNNVECPPKVLTPLP